MDRFEVKFAADDVDAKTGTFTGYGSVSGNVDSYGDVVAKGAFKGTLREWKAQKRLPPMLVQHGGWMMGDMDALPIGVWTAMEEDEVGLKVEGRIINLDTERGKTIYGAMKEGALDGLSIGYRAKKFTLGTKPDEPRRTLEQIDLLEVSLVTFPANGKARVGAVKGADEFTIRDLERHLVSGTLPPLRDRDAKALLSGGFKAMRRDAEGADDVAEMIRRNITVLKG